MRGSGRIQKAVGYVRLSREDIRGPGATEEKLQARARMCLTLAERHGLDLREEDILIERESGTTLARSEMQRLLEMTCNGLVTHVVTPYQDRLSRGDKRDQQTIEDAFSAGRIVLVTLDGEITFDENFDTRHGLVWDVRSAVARQFVRDLVKKRKETDRDRLNQNLRSRGFAPYGYRWRRATKDQDGNPDKPQSYEVIEAEYEIVQEIFRRIRRDSMHAIVDDLNARGVLVPGVGRTSFRNADEKLVKWTPENSAGKKWTRSTLKGIVLNPFYAGYYAQRQRVEWHFVTDRHTGQQKQVKRAHRLEPDEYILAEKEGTWKHPITLADWHEIVSVVTGRKLQTAPRSAVLTGILYCPNGRPMRRHARDCYGCDCLELGQPHAGIHTSQPRLDRWVGEIVWSALQVVPKDDWPTFDHSNDRQDLALKLRRAERVVEEKQDTVDDLQKRARFNVKQFGRASYERACRSARKELDAAIARRNELKAAQSKARPDLRALHPYDRLRNAGWMNVWQHALMTPAAKREVVRCVIERIELQPIPEGRRFYRSAKVVLLGWLSEYPKPDLPPFPVKRFAA